MYVHKWVHTGRGHREFTEIIHVQSVNSYFACLLEQGANGSIRLQNKILQEWRYSAIKLVHNSMEGASLTYSEWLVAEIRFKEHLYRIFMPWWTRTFFFWDYQKEGHSCVVLPVKINGLLKEFLPLAFPLEECFFVGIVFIFIYLLSEAENNLDSDSI